MERVTGSPRETEEIAAGLAARLAPGDVVAGSGELGAGETTFGRGAARALGGAKPGPGPTFTTGHRYEGRVRVAPLALYRLDGIPPEEWGDLEPYFERTVAFVEWPEHARGGLPSARF